MDNVYNTAPAAKKLVLKEERQKIPHCTQRTQNHLSEDGVLIFTRQRVFKPNSQKKKFPLPNEGKIGRTWDLTQATVITPCNKATSLPLQRKQTQLFLQRWWREASRGGNLAAGDTRPWPARSRRNTWPSCHTQPPPGRRWRRIPCNREQGLLHTLSLSCGPHPAACASLLRFDRSLRLLAHLCRRPQLPEVPLKPGAAHRLALHHRPTASLSYWLCILTSASFFSKSPSTLKWPVSQPWVRFLLVIGWTALPVFFNVEIC